MIVDEPFLAQSPRLKVGFESDWLTNFVHILKQSAINDRRGKRVGDHPGITRRMVVAADKATYGENRLERDWLHGVVE